MVDAGFENQKELTKMQLDNQKEIAEMQNETQKEIAGIQSATSRQNTKDQVYAQNEMLAYFFFSSRRRHTRYWRDWSSDVCSSDLGATRIKRRPALIFFETFCCSRVKACRHKRMFIAKSSILFSNFNS